MATSVTQYEITWTFDADYTVGQYVNGDYYVVDPGSGVTINSTTPASASGENGSMINPTVSQSYDDSSDAYDAGQLVSFPVTLDAGDSLVTAKSALLAEQSGGEWNPSWNDKGYTAPSQGGHTVLKSAAVLTVVSSSPASGTFRPYYGGTNKTTHNRNDINEDWLINLPAPSGFDSVEIDFLERGLQRPWIIHPNDFQARNSHPYENQFSYHRDIGDFFGEASVALLTDAWTEDLLIGYVQTALDYYYMTTLGGSGTLNSGTGDSAFWKWPVIFIGLLFDEPDIYRLFTGVQGTDYRSTPRSQEKAYYIKDGTSTFVSAITPANETWTGSRVGFRKQVANGEHEHADPSEWTDPDVNGGNGKSQETYRQGVDSRQLLGFVMSAILLSRCVQAPGVTAGTGDASHADTVMKLWFPNGGTFDGSDTEEYAAFDYLYRWMEENFDDDYKSYMESQVGSVTTYTQTFSGPGLSDIYRKWVEWLRITSEYTIGSDTRIDLTLREEKPIEPNNPIALL
jgi:hypothetical protein